MLAAADLPYALVIHGGAGVQRADLSPEHEASCRATLEVALSAGEAVLKAGGSSLDAVQAAIVVLEDSPNFNAGRGSALTSAGTVEMDAAVMVGETRAAGAVAGVTGVRNPIKLARLVMEKTPHVLLGGQGAEAVAREHGLAFEAPEWFIVPAQQEKLRRVQEKLKASQASAVEPSAVIGTVGAVALDRAGHLAAGTSTGGIVNKMPGRIGDTPIIGAGTYAEDGVCAVSGTGHGEYFIRAVVAHEIASLMKYRQLSAKDAASEVVHQELKHMGGEGGVIVLDSNGQIATPYNTQGMFHAWVKADGTRRVAIFEE